MHAPQSAPVNGAAAASKASGRGGIPVQPLDRSHLLRRPKEFPFQLPYENGVVRIRRERRVFESFSAIRALARRSST